MTIAATTIPHRVPGALIWAPTAGALTGRSLPYGGTTLGLCADGIEYDLIERIIEDVSREDGGHVFDVARAQVRALLRTRLLQREQALPRGWPGLTTTDANGKQILQLPGSAGDGAWLAGQGGKLLFCPDDETNHPFVLLRKAVGHLVRQGPLAVESERWYEVEFLGLPDTAWATTAERVLVDALKAGVTV